MEWNNLAQNTEESLPVWKL